MIWVVLVLAVLCIAMSGVALWYREQWCFEKHRQNTSYCEIKEKYDKLKEENARTLQEIGALNIEIGKLRSHIPKRDSKGRFCKRK